MVHKYTLILSLFLFIVVFCPAISTAQSAGYEVLPSPDLWYNDVDGIRLGVNLKGQVPGTFEDGPHRLDAGFWVGLWFPDLPVSYYLNYTEPISRWSDFGSEASIEVISSIRTGYHNHGVAYNKRWQQGFDERKYREVRIYNSYEKRSDLEYTPFEQLWSDKDKFLTTFSAELRSDNRLGWYQIRANASFQYLNDQFSIFTLSANQSIEFNSHFALHLRGYGGFASSGSSPEYLHSRSMRPAIRWMENGVIRAKGTIPQPWMESGNIHVAGGANVRGYTAYDVESFQKECVILAPESGNCIDEEHVPLLFHSIISMNAELDYWNPVTFAFNQIPYASEFLEFRSYLFFDTGRSLEFIDHEPHGTFSNAGAGFSLSMNIPDYRGKDRGFVFRYEIPFWLSESADEDSFKFRHLFGFGAVISF